MEGSDELRELIESVAKGAFEKLGKELPKGIQQERLNQAARLSEVGGQLERIGDILESFLKLQMVQIGIDPRAVAAVNLYPDEDEKDAVPEILTTPESEIAQMILDERERESKGFTEDESEEVEGGR